MGFCFLLFLAMLLIHLPPAGYANSGYCYKAHIKCKPHRKQHGALWADARLCRTETVPSVIVLAWWNSNKLGDVCICGFFNSIFARSNSGQIIFGSAQHTTHSSWP